MDTKKERSFPFIALTSLWNSVFSPNMTACCDNQFFLPIKLLIFTLPSGLLKWKQGVRLVCDRPQPATGWCQKEAIGKEAQQ